MSRGSQEVEAKTIKNAVKEKYSAIARGECPPQAGCCATPKAVADVFSTIRTMARGYDPGELADLPEGANLGLGCGNPIADADFALGQTVLDLGSGGGVDCFLAALRVGSEGYVIGVDMTDEMLSKARENARRGGFSNVEFRKGEIEDLPVESSSVDRIISNCVINLAPDKARVYAEAYRVLKPGGAITVSDIVSIGVLPQWVRADMERWAGCTAGALEKEAYLEVIRRAGFSHVTVVKEVVYDFLRGPEYALASLTVRAVK